MTMRQGYHEDRGDDHDSHFDLLQAPMFNLLAASKFGTPCNM